MADRSRFGVAVSVTSIAVLHNTRIGDDQPENSDRVSLLERELFRQAVARAIEHNSGWLVIDANLHETTTGLVDKPSIHLRTRLHRFLTEADPARRRYTFGIQVRKDGDPNWETVAKWQAYVKPNWLFLAPLLDACYAATNDEILAALTELDLPITVSLTITPDGDVPAEVNELSTRINFVAQWRAAPDLTRIMHTDGMSVPRLAARARIYALLAEMTRPHLSSATQVFMARGLLDAAEAFDIGKGDLMVAQTMAFCLSMAGYHKPSDGLFRVAHAQLHAENQPLATWAQAAKAANNFDHATLLNLSDDEHGGLGLAALFGALAQEDRPFAAERDDAARRSIERNPVSVRTLLAWWNSVGV